MSLRWRMALAMAAIASVATIALGVASYRSTRDRLFAEVDRSLVELDRLVSDRRFGMDRLPQRGPLSGFDAQVIQRDGSVGQSTFPDPLPLGDAERAVVGSPRASVFTTVDAPSGSYRVRTVGLSQGAIQIGRSLDETDRLLSSLRARTLLLVVLVAAAASTSGWWIASRVTASLRRLTVAAEHVESTGRLDVQVREQGSDEVGRLGVAFDRMLAALARSKDEQHRLVQDAGHELRTPLTSLRTNLDTLRRYPTLGDDDRAAIVADLRAETEELTDLLNEIVAVASGEVANEPATSFDLAAVAGETARRYERRTGRSIVVHARPTPVVAQRAGVQRAISCLLDNACKFDTSGGPVELRVEERVDGDAVTVLDRGPGIPVDELDRVFDRFHRVEDARTLPGSGLGLSIVRDVARRHGGDAFAANRDDGGAAVGFRLGGGRPSSRA